MKKNWQITQRPVTVILPAHGDTPETKMEMFRCALVCTKETQHLNAVPDFTEMSEWCYKNLGNQRDFNGNPVWRFSTTFDNFTFAREEDALAFILAFRTA